jgi:hypothetical protein
MKAKMYYSLLKMHYLSFLSNHSTFAHYLFPQILEKSDNPI